MSVPLLLTPPCGAVPGNVLSYVGSVKGAVGSAVLFGGASAVGDDVQSQLDGALG
jgi:hypothetical protein